MLLLPLLHFHAAALLFFMFIILLIFSKSNSHASSTTDHERAILLSLKHEWGNPSLLDSWSSTSSPCDDHWFSISCKAGSVTEISLQEMMFQGISFPSTIICQLNNITSIYLNFIILQGSIPASISNCSKLEELNLSDNDLTGQIAGELFSLKRLRSLNLGSNMLTGEIPKSMVAAYSLESLDLSGNLLLNGSIPKGIGNLNNLSNLDLSWNRFNGPIPTTLQLNHLSRLSLTHNKLIGEIPGELFTMLSLVNLNLSHNMLSCEIPTPLVSSSLESLDLSSNLLNGSIPKDIGNLNNLSNLDLSWNRFNGPIPTTLQLNHLSRLSLTHNKLIGEIPGELFTMLSLVNLNLSHNMLSGEIPTPLVSSSLESLDLSSNKLNGSIPEDIGNLDNLHYLDLSMNSFSGSIPATLLQMNTLNHLSLASNNLTGEIPRKLDFSSLNEIDLSYNHLRGSIPLDFEKLPLRLLDVSHNQFSGDIVKIVNHLKDVTNTLLTISTCANNFSGRISKEVVNDRFSGYNCIDNINLCSDVMTDGFPACSSYIRSSEKDNKSWIMLICIITFGVMALLVGLSILKFVFRRWMEGRRKGIDGDQEEWSMTTFQMLEFSKWEILVGVTDENLIGNGGSGKVYKVITRKGQRVAVKSIHEEKQNHNLEKQFLAEVKILGGIRHNNIVKLLCCIRGKRTKLIVYEYMDKQCLNKWLHGKKKGLTLADNCTQVLHWERRLKIAIGAAQGLSYMHHDCNPPIVHRDIKSSNILLDYDFNAKVADFGLAKMLASEGDPEIASAVVGTFGYIAPEYGITRKVSVKSDIYSFGVVLLELTTGREAVTLGEDMNLAQWAHKQHIEGRSVIDVLDEEIRDPCYLEAAITAFKLGLMCTQSLPSSRPSMKDILQILQRCNNNQLSLGR